MKPFKKGDRVRVYCTRPFIGEVSYVDEPLDLVEVKEKGAGHSYGPFHVKQCRKLVKKPLREFWVNIYGNGCIFVHASKEIADQFRAECIHVREVREK